jgi:hypothetical protein
MVEARAGEVVSLEITTDRHISLIRRFYDLLLQSQPPRVREYQEVFGHHAEWELAFLLAHCRKQGWVPEDQSPACLGYTKSVSSTPEAHQSRFFESLRKAKHLFWQPPNPDGRPNVFVGWSLYGQRDDRASLAVVIRRPNLSRFEVVEFWVTRLETDLLEYGHIIDIRAKGRSLLELLTRQRN